MSLDEQTGFKGKVVRDHLPASATPRTAGDAAREIAKVDWECPHCHRVVKLNAKGSHLRSCKLNPARKRHGAKKGSQRTDSVPCKYCEKLLSPAAMDQHVRATCRVAQAIRDGRVLAPVPVPPIVRLAATDTQPAREFFEGVVIEDSPPIDKSITEERARRTLAELTANALAVDEIHAERRQLMRGIIELAVDEIVEDQTEERLSFRAVALISDAIDDLVQVLMGQL